MKNNLLIQARILNNFTCGVNQKKLLIFCRILPGQESCCVTINSRCITSKLNVESLILFKKVHTIYVI